MPEPRLPKPRMTEPYQRPSPSLREHGTQNLHPKSSEPSPPCTDKPTAVPQTPVTVERLIQTDAELNQATTQTTPTVSGG